MTARVLKKSLFRREAIAAIAVLVLLALTGLAWESSGGITPAELAEKMAAFKSNPWASLITIAGFVIGGLFFVPLTVMTVATAMTFGPVQGIIISVLGASSSAATTYCVGYFLGHHGLRRWMGPLCDKLQRQVEEIGVLGMVVLRLVFLVPYTMGNIAFGIIGTRFVIFIAGSFLALIPGAVVRSILGASIMDFWRHPDLKNTAYIVAGTMGWILLIIFSHYAARQWKEKKPQRL